MEPVETASDTSFTSQEFDSLPRETSLIASLAKPFFALIDYFYGVNPVLGKREFGFLPTWVEKTMGTTLYPGMMFSQGGAVPDHFELSQVRQILSNLQGHAKRDLPYEVHILNKNVVNAWCLPGGKIAIYKGILERIDYYVNHKDAMGLKGYTHPETDEFISYAGVTKDDVIAALLGHEMTHADARHTGRKLEWSFLVQAFIFTLSAFSQIKINNWKNGLETRTTHLSQPDNPTTTASQEQLEREKNTLQTYQYIHNLVFSWLIKLGVELYFLMGSRHHELEADKYGTQLAVKGGYNPAGALFLQEILKAESHGLYDYLPTWYQKIQGLWHSHPPPTERQAALFNNVKDWTSRGV
jgi:Zn-dependent protease with chaperone function